jgi:beta-xylosidase
VATAVAAIGLAGTVSASPVQAATGCAVTYTVTNQWGGGFGANVSVKNLGDPVDGWKLTWAFTAGQTITSLWNGTASQSGSQVSVTNASYNAAIATGGTAEFGFNGAWNNSSNPVPASFSLNGSECTGTVDGTPPTSTPPTSVSPTSVSPTTVSPTTVSPTTVSPTTVSPTTVSPTTVAPTTTTAGPWPPSSTYSNPTLWEDFADIDVIRVGDVYYASASTMHYSPGAPVLRSYDLVHWEVAGHSVPRLDFDNNAYDLGPSGRAYVKGIWASAFNYRKSNSTYYWLGCVEFNRTYVYTASQPDGNWTKKAKINNCYYDAGMLIDDNDTMYVAYGNTNISVAQLSADGTSQVRSQQVFTTPSSVGTLEGSRFYKRGNNYYIFLTRPANGQYVLKSTNGPFGPYEMKQVLLNLPGPISGGGVPHQGGLVQTQNGDWYYMAFIDAYPGGRVPALAPITWTSDGWPQLQTVNGTWGASYPFPNIPRPSKTVKPPTGTDTFSTLGPEWEWNHNPDTSKYSTGNGLKLQTANVTNDLYSARNTLTHRILGPSSTATIQLDYGSMKDGDRSGLAMLRQSSAWIGVKRDNGANRVVMTNGLTMNSSWGTTGTGTEVASANISGGRIWLRANADIRPGSNRQATFSYSTDGTTFRQLGTFSLNNDWQFFMGYRFGIFNYASSSLGGSVTVPQFTLSTP